MPSISVGVDKLIENNSPVVNRQDREIDEAIIAAKPFAPAQDDTTLTQLLTNPKVDELLGGETTK